MKNTWQSIGALALCLTIAFTVQVYAQSGPARLSLSVAPGVSWPAWDGDILGVGASTTASARFGLGSVPVSLGPEIGYTFQPIKNTTNNLSLVAFGALADLDLRLTPWLQLSPYGQGGYFFGIASGSSGRSVYFGGGLDMSFSLGKSFGIDLSGGYRSYYGLFQTVTASLAATYKLGASAGEASTGAPAQPPTQAAPGIKPQPLKSNSAQGKNLQISQVSLDPVFPVLFKFYDDHAIGKLSIKNSGKAAVQGVKVSLFVSQYMDNPKLCATISRLEPGAEASADLFALFNDKLLDVSEGTKVSTRISLEYSVSGAEAAQDDVETLRIFDRNASMWDDNRKAAAFVTSKDPTVLRFSKNVLAMIKDKGSRAVNQNLLTAMAFHEATRLYGLTYVTDPTNSYAAVLENKTAVDFLQFPRQTLDYKGGNCSALSILYSALLESVGIETAFITVPGHIFMAVSLGEPPDRARKDFIAPDDLILIGDKSWLPIETTARSAGFLEAWASAAKEWRENLSKEQAELYPVHDAWARYEPVGFASDMGNITLPDADKVASAYLEELVHFIDQEIYPEVAKLRTEITRTKSSPKAVNQLGVLYARYGLTDRAEVEFKKALKGGDYPFALINLGNIQYLHGKFLEALAYFKRAQAVAPNNPTLLLAVARSNHELENYGVAKAEYEQLKAADPALAERYAYLDLKGDEGKRAANITGVNDQVEWGQE